MNAINNLDFHIILYLILVVWFPCSLDLFKIKFYCKNVSVELYGISKPAPKQTIYVSGAESKTIIE